METTGLSPKQDRILEIAVVLVDSHGRPQHEWSTRVNPQGPVGATHIHGIRQADVAHAPVFSQLTGHLSRLLGGRAVVAHNARFDLGFVQNEFGRAGWGWPAGVPVLCTLQESKYFLPQLDRRRLLDLCWASGIALTDAHSALGDARATATLLASYLDPQFGLPPLPHHRGVLGDAVRVTWPTGPGASKRPLRPAAPVSPVSPGNRAGTGGRSAAEAQRIRSALNARPTRVANLLERFTLSDALDEGAPQGTEAYLELLIEVLEDGQISDAEASALAELAALYDLTSDDVAAARNGLVRALAREAVEDGVLSRAEKSEITHIAELLSVPAAAVKDLLEGEEESRLVALSSRCAPLPDPWPFGQPLRVGERVVFTGGEPAHRQHLEDRAVAVGLRVSNSVSRRTSALVTDGSFDGGKAAAAAELKTRVVSPAVFALLLDHVQAYEPAPSRSARSGRAAGTGQVPPTKPDQRPGASPFPAHVATTGGAADATPTADGAASSTYAVPARPPAADVRAWARTQGYDVGVRGRISSDVWDAYAAAHPVA